MTNETLLTLTAATKLIPPRRGAKRTNVSTLYRWAQRGLRGVKLETVQVGGTRMTTKEALSRFFNDLRAADQGLADHNQSSSHAKPTPDSVTARAQAADEILIKMGCI
jgi:hypothetical protein